jgi:hypothetical protein
MNWEIDWRGFADELAAKLGPCVSRLENEFVLGVLAQSPCGHTLPPRHFELSCYGGLSHFLLIR